MLFYIDKTIGAEIEANNLSSNEIMVLQSLAVAVQRGNCIVCGEYHCLTVLANLSDNIGVVFRKILSKYAMQRSIMEKVNIIFCISKGNALDLPPFIVDKVRELQIDAIANLQLDLFQKCVLVCENQHDCEYYSLLGAVYCFENRLHDYPIRFTFQGGGGQTTADSYENMVCREKRPTLCIVDSDKRHGNNCEFGKTCKDVISKTTMFSNETPPFQTYILPVHEIENIVPIPILERIYSKKNLIDSYATLLRQLAEVENGTPLLYYDLKNGFTNLSGEDELSQYWNNIIRRNEIDLSGFDNVLPPVVDRKYLEKVVIELREMVNNHELIEFEPCLECIVSDIKQVVFSWGCVGTPMFV